jgi:hypothetical protein
MISSCRLFFPESCVRQFAETRGKYTFTAWASASSGRVPYRLARSLARLTFSRTDKVLLISIAVSCSVQVEQPDSSQKLGIICARGWLCGCSSRAVSV